MSDGYIENDSKLAHYAERFVAFNKLREANELCDVTLIAEGKRLRAHRVVLSSGSPYFWKMFTSSMLETNSEEICIPDINYETMEQVIEYLYTSRVRLTTENAQNILIASNFLQITSLVDLCGKYVLKQIDCTNCLSMKELFTSTNCNEKMITRAKDYINRNFPQISRNESFIQLDIKSVVELLSSTEVCYGSEEDVCHGAIRWLNASEDRTKYAQQIFNCIRLPLLSNTFKSKYIENNPLFKNVALNRNVEPTDAPRTLKTSLMALNKGDQNSLHVYDPETKNWTKFIDVESKPYTCFVASENYVVLAKPDNHQSLSCNTDILDLKAKQFVKLPPLPLAFEHGSRFEVVIVGCRLYFFAMKYGVRRGSFSIFMIVYNVESESWSHGFPAIFSTSDPCFLAVDRNIYLFEVSGTSDTKLRSLDTETNNWSDVGIIKNQSSYCRLKTTYRGRIYFAFNSLRGSEYPASFGVYDPATNEKKELAAIRDSKIMDLVATSDGIYALRDPKIGNPKVQTASATREMDFYDVENDEWRFEGTVPEELDAVCFTAVSSFYCQP